MGIIPARAGFTAHRAVRSSVASDHPRSRGVYFSPGLDTEVGQGSSPLARGLLAANARARLAAGIIPARAGFTFWWPSGRRR